MWADTFLRAEQQGIHPCGGNIEARPGLDPVAAVQGTVDLHVGPVLADRHRAEVDGGVLVVTEGVFGMAGDQGRLKEIVSLKKKYGFRLLVDDAHGFGTLGKTGAGAGEEQGVQQDIDLYFSTFAKSMASIGGFVSGDKPIVDYIRYNIRSQIFAKSLPMPFVLGNLKRLELLRNNTSLKEKLWKNALKLQEGLKKKGFDIGKTDSVVTPIYMKGDIPEATSMVMDLREKYGIFCSIVVYPVIPKGHIIYRLIPSAAHTDADIEETLTAFTETKAKLDAGAYKVEAIPDMAEESVTGKRFDYMLDRPKNK